MRDYDAAHDQMNDNSVESAPEDRPFCGDRELAAYRVVDRSNGERDYEVKEQT